MAAPPLKNYLRTYRRRAGLSQQEVAFLVGTRHRAQFSRYEKYQCLPPLRIALACEAVLRVPVSKLFAGVSNEVTREVDERIDTLNARLQERSNHKRYKLRIQRKLA